MWCLWPPERFTGCVSPGRSFGHQHYLRGGGLLEQLRNGSSLIAAAQIEPYWQNNCVEYFPFSLVWWCERRLWAVSMQEKETGRFPASQSAHERAARIETWLTASICLQFITMWRGIMLDTSLKGKSWQTGAIYSRLFLTDSNCIDWSLIQMCCHPRCWADEWKNSGSRPSIQFHSEPIFFFFKFNFHYCVFDLNQQWHTHYSPLFQTTKGCFWCEMHLWADRKTRKLISNFLFVYSPWPGSLACVLLSCLNQKLTFTQSHIQ